ncbi:MAG: glutamine-hydrolyzing GMP synthase [Candidatus Eisenbacteria bacterium]
MKHEHHIVVLDFGSQYTQLIARRIREMGVYCEIVPYWSTVKEIAARHPRGIILSGGPRSVHEKDAPMPAKGIFDLGMPVLGICYGLQVIAKVFGGKVTATAGEEYGPRVVTSVGRHRLFTGVRKRIRVWMSHADYVQALPRGWRAIAGTESCRYCAVHSPDDRVFGLQFHPEVSHSDDGTKVLRNFVFRICGARKNWSMESFVESAVEKIKEEVGENPVVCALSGGVDSSVAASLVSRAVGDRLTAIFVDNGLQRKHEGDAVRMLCKECGIRLRYIKAAGRFLAKLRGVSSPERKRRLIGREFIKVFEEAAVREGGVKYLVQGTLYPDVIESVSVRGPSSTIKSHHNVGGLPRRMKLRLVEPLRELFKDEVREVGKIIGVPPGILARHPFPGPGLAVRIIGEVTGGRLSILRDVDWIFIDEIEKAGLYSEIWQAFGVLLPVRSVGVMGDRRTYEFVVALRAVTSRDGMTADWARIPPRVLEKISARIVNSVRRVNRVVYDVTSKPPGTIEWE